MGANDEKGKPGPAKDDQNKPNQAIQEYLQSGKKKKKSFVAMCFSRFLDPDLPPSIDGFVRTKSPENTIVYPKTPDDLVRQFKRQISLLVYDDEFTDLESGLTLIGELKKTKLNQGVPVVFLTRRPRDLIQSYKAFLAPYHEMDDYVNYARQPSHVVLDTIQRGLFQKNRRRSRRYGVDIPVAYFNLFRNDYFSGRLLDLSIHGARLKSESEQVFRTSDQLKVHLPISKFLPPEEGDFLRLSARVRRVFINGIEAGISFEYMSERQTTNLTKFLTELVNSQISRQNLAERAKAARAKQESG